MISKRIKSRKDGKSSARAALRYGEGLRAGRDRVTGEVKDKSHRTRFGGFRLIDDGVYVGQDVSTMAGLLDLAAVELQSNCDLNTRVGNDKKLAHFVISFNQEKPAEAVLRDTEDSMLAALGLDNNHFASFLHNDNGYWHLHLFASCIEKDAPHRANPLWQDRTKRDKICREIERRHGLSRDNGLHEIDAHGRIVEVSRAQRQAKREAGPQKSDRAQTVERYSGERTFQTWCTEIRIGDRLKHAKSWQDLHAAAAAYNCEIKSKGAGFVLCPIGEKGGISLSTVGLKKLPAKFGAFQPAQPRQGVEAEAAYKPDATRKTGSLYPEWQQAKAEFRKTKTTALNALRNEHATERAELRKRQRAELGAIRSSAAGQDRAVAISVAKLQHAVALTELAAEHAAERQQVRRKLAETAPGATYRDYLIKQAGAGNDAALEQARAYGAAEATSVSIQREAEQLEVVAAAAGGLQVRPAQRLNFSHRIERSGTVIFDLGNGRQLIDSAISKQIQLNHAAALDPSAVETSLRFATSKFGNKLTLTGPAEFQKLAVETAVKKGLGIQFLDPALDAYRQKLEAERAASRFTPPVKTPGVDREYSHEAPAERSGSYPSGVAVPAWGHLNPIDLYDAIEEFIATGFDEGVLPEPIRRTQAPLENAVLNQRSQIDKEKVYAALVADAKQKGLVYDIKPSVPYVGTVKEISPCGRFAIQDQGRGAVVVHDLAKLEGQYVAGQNAEIVYRDGVGRDKLQDAEHAHRLRPGIDR